VHRVLVEMPEGRRALGRWENNINMEHQEVGGACGNCMVLTQVRGRWRTLVSTVMNSRVEKCGEFLD